MTGENLLFGVDELLTSDFERLKALRRGVLLLAKDLPGDLTSSIDSNFSNRNHSTVTDGVFEQGQFC